MNSECSLLVVDASFLGFWWNNLLLVLCRVEKVGRFGKSDCWNHRRSVRDAACDRRCDCKSCKTLWGSAFAVERSTLWVCSTSATCASSGDEHWHHHPIVWNRAEWMFSYHALDLCLCITLSYSLVHLLHVARRLIWSFTQFFTQNTHFPATRNIHLQKIFPSNFITECCVLQL